MTDSYARMTEKGDPPKPDRVAEWIGEGALDLWNELTEWIDRNYPGVFIPEWLFGGLKHGWYLRYKKSKSFCSFIPEKGWFKLLIVFGAEKRAKVETNRKEFSTEILATYDAAKTFHDGKWLLVKVDSRDRLEDVRRFLLLKRKPKTSKP